jgi:Xaa-Pro aminopeptidase
VNGVFTEPQRALYDVVLDAQKKGINEVRTGKTVRDPHIAASRAITEGLVRLGILSGNVETLLEEGLEPGSKVSFRRFFMHGTGHWLGLDTHDTGDYRDKDKHPRSYKPGMVVTVEPGLYIQPSPDVPEAFWNIGIRIEDDVLVTKGNPRVLTSFVPKEVKAIEALMKKR